MMLINTSLKLKKVVVSGLGFCSIRLSSIGSFSYMMEQVGPIIISKKIMCTGVKIFGYIQPKANGINTIKIIGI